MSCRIVSGQVTSCQVTSRQVVHVPWKGGPSAKERRKRQKRGGGEGREADREEDVSVRSFALFGRWLLLPDLLGGNNGAGGRTASKQAAYMFLCPVQRLRSIEAKVGTEEKKNKKKRVAESSS